MNAMVATFLQVLQAVVDVWSGRLCCKSIFEVACASVLELIPARVRSLMRIPQGAAIEEILSAEMPIDQTAERLLQQNRRVDPGSCTPSPHRSGRDTLASSGSCHHAKAAAFH